MITLISEALFAVIFARTLFGYVRSRDPLQRDVMLVFTAAATLFISDMYHRLVGPVPSQVAAVTGTLLLTQPYLTLRLAGRLRSVPRWLNGAVLLATAAAAVPIAFAPRPLSKPLIALFVLVFVATEVVATILLATTARRRTGAARARLTIVAWATGLFAAALAMAGAAGFLGGARAWLSGDARVVALVSAVGYVVAFVPPAWLRRIWSASAWYDVSERLQRLPAMASTGEIWQRYVDLVRGKAGVDAVVLLTTASENEAGGVTVVACAGLSPEAPAGFGPRQLDELVRAKQPIAAFGRAGDAVPLAAHYARVAGAGFVTVLPLRVPEVERAALLLLDRHRSLVTDGDLRLLRLLGEQAAVLAQRGAVLADQRRLAEELAVSVDALTHASQAKSDFLAGMSHELRTPLNAIIGFSDLMRAEQPQGDQRRVPAEWVDHIHTSGRHLLGLINDILDLAKVEAGRLDLNLQPLRLDVATVEAVTALRPLTDGKTLSVDVRVPPLRVLADPQRYRQILDNLLSNAIKFTPEGGRISVSAARIGQEVALTVADTGVGIKPADQARVFDEFQQVGDPAQRIAGTGLGLALTRRLVEAHGGVVALESALGEGSRFTIRLPDATDEPGDMEVDRPGPDRFRGRVLAIEDDRRSAELLRTYLTGAGYEVVTARSGESGLTAARGRRPDAILLDVQLPGIDGWGVIRQLKADEALRGIPVFFVTVIDDRQAGIALGATDYFVKPVDHNALLAQLAQHIMPAGAQPPAVLIVDRDETTRRVVAERLRAAGVDVTTCADGREGLRLSQRRQFDLIVCDLQMPDVDGFALLSALDADPATRAIPVLALTAPDLSDVDRVRLTGKVIGAVPKGTAMTADFRDWVALATVVGSPSTGRGGES